LHSPSITLYNFFILLLNDYYRNIKNTLFCLEKNYQTMYN
jgi:hypothetical protein